MFLERFLIFLYNVRKQSDFCQRAAEADQKYEKTIKNLFSIKFFFLKLSAVSGKMLLVGNTFYNTLPT